ncbi:MAG: hypothetical protein IJO59_07375 [Clostridia bacterium]|nr:hypothetical protein [Clostridia bacterium]
MKLFNKNHLLRLLLPMVVILSACGEQGSVVTTTTAPTTTTTTTTAATTTTAQITTTVATTATTTTRETTTVLSTTTMTKVTTTTVSKTTSAAVATTTTELTTSTGPNLPTPSENKRQLMLAVNGEDVLLTFSNSTVKGNGPVEWIYKGAATDGLSITCTVVAEQERICLLSYSWPGLGRGEGPLQEEEIRSFAVSELHARGFATDGSDMIITIAVDLINGEYAEVDVTLSDAQRLWLQMRKVNGKFYLCGFAAALNSDISHPYLLPRWISE